jgi:Ca-activated chloride channel homolog
MHHPSNLISHRWLILAVAAGLTLTAGLVLAQAPNTKPPDAKIDAKSSDQPGPDDGDVPIFRSDTQRVLLHVSVLDKNGKLITNLPQSAFKVTENGVEQKVKLFRREDVPVSMGLIIDNSGSMREQIAKVNAAALLLVKESNPDDEVFVFNFNDDTYLDQEFTNDIKKLEEALEKATTRGGTAMRNAVSLGIDYAKEKGKKDKKVLIVVTDGNDTASTETSLEQLVRKAQRSEVLIYSIGLLDKEDPREARAAKRALKALAEASGGLDYYPKDLDEVQSITPEIAHEIRNQYLLEYSPSNQNLDGTYRTIKVTLTGNAPRGAVVRHRNGYYASPLSNNKGPAVTIKK